MRPSYFGGAARVGASRPLPPGTIRTDLPRGDDAPNRSREDSDPVDRSPGLRGQPRPRLVGPHSHHRSAAEMTSSQSFDFVNFEFESIYLYKELLEVVPALISTYPT